VNEAPPATSPESNEPSSAVTVWVRSLTFCHVALSPGSTSICEGPKAWNWMFTDPVSAAAGAATVIAAAATAAIASRFIAG